MAVELPSAQVVDAAAAFPIEDSTLRFSGHIVDLRTDLVRMPDGALAERDIVIHPGAVGAIVLDDRERVLLVRQYRHAPGRMLWEPPAGLLDGDAGGQTPYQNAARELFEEAGYRATDWRVLIDLFTTPGMSDEAVRVYLARGVTQVADDQRHVGQHEEADMPYAWVPLDEAVGKVLAGDLHNPLAVAGILAAAAARTRGFDTLRPAGALWPERPAP
ncbi:NUDIX hydrolase [Acidothermaceae bacterium B102]|nr:NUDIX hydrolase [Acidothermaceae bacterium B102]